MSYIPNVASLTLAFLWNDHMPMWIPHAHVLNLDFSPVNLSLLSWLSSQLTSWWGEDLFSQWSYLHLHWRLQFSTSFCLPSPVVRNASPLLYGWGGHPDSVPLSDSLWVTLLMVNNCSGRGLEPGSNPCAERNITRKVELLVHRSCWAVTGGVLGKLQN